MSLLHCWRPSHVAVVTLHKPISSATMPLAQLMRRLASRAVRDKRPEIPFSYGWLNALCGTLCDRNDAARIRPAYTWGVLQAAALGRALGHPRISVVEFGVAGGRGLKALERIAELVEHHIPVQIDVFGFDTGQGLPKPTDYRDHPNLYAAGGYKMDHAALRGTLARAQLVLGDVSATLTPWLDTKPAPVGFVSWDLDYYSSTMAAFALLDATSSLLLPRIVSYFDDTMGLTFGDHVGERAAIADFNTAHELRKLSPIYGLRHYLPWPQSRAMWPEMMYMAHLFDHPLYNEHDQLIPVDHAPLIR